MERDSEDFNVGDTVYCLAWLGKAFQVVAKDEATGRVSLEAATASDPRGAQVDLYPDMLWMATHEPWDQIWYWPDRAGETYDEVFERFVKEHPPGEIVRGYTFGPDDYGLYLAPDASRSVALRVQGTMLNMLLVEPVAPVDGDGKLLAVTDPDVKPDAWVAVGGGTALRLGMVGYRWCLSFGEFIVNSDDLMHRMPGHEQGFASIKHPDGTFSRPTP